jgi:hypothetical protein
VAARCAATDPNVIRSNSVALSWPPITLDALLASWARNGTGFPPAMTVSIGAEQVCRSSAASSSTSSCAFASSSPIMLWPATSR